MSMCITLFLSVTVMSWLTPATLMPWRVSSLFFLLTVLSSEFELCRVGSIDVESGVLTPSNPVRIAWQDLSLTMLLQGVSL